MPFRGIRVAWSERETMKRDKNLKCLALLRDLTETSSNSYSLDQLFARISS